MAVFGVGGVGLNAVQGGAMVAAQPIIAVDVVGSKLESARQLGPPTPSTPPGRTRWRKSGASPGRRRLHVRGRGDARAVGQAADALAPAAPAS